MEFTNINIEYVGLAHARIWRENLIWRWAIRLVNQPAEKDVTGVASTEKQAREKVDALIEGW